MPARKEDVVTEKRRYLSSAARKEEILDAALVEFSDRTYNAVSMESVQTLVTFMSEFENERG